MTRGPGRRASRMGVGGPAGSGWRLGQGQQAPKIIALRWITVRDATGPPGGHAGCGAATKITTSTLFQGIHGRPCWPVWRRCTHPVFRRTCSSRPAPAGVTAAARRSEPPEHAQSLQLLQCFDAGLPREDPQRFNIDLGHREQAHAAFSHHGGTHAALDERQVCRRLDGAAPAAAGSALTCRTRAPAASRPGSKLFSVSLGIRRGNAVRAPAETVISARRQGQPCGPQPRRQRHRRQGAMGSLINTHLRGTAAWRCHKGLPLNRVQPSL